MRTSKDEDDLSGLVHAALLISSEGGEFTTEVKRMFAYGKPMTDEMHAHMIEELGDALWGITKACSHLGVSLKRVAEKNIDKLALRFPDKFSGEAALARADKGGLGHRES
jgi:NTP pyrophosphatase (non-canonical NTP hydrolase)